MARKFSSPNVHLRRESSLEEYEIIIAGAYGEIYQQKLVDTFLKHSRSANEIEAELMSKIMDNLYDNSNFAKNLIDCVLKENRKLPFIQFYNLLNLQHFANIFNTISLHLDDKENENFELNFAIIYIAERTFYSKLCGDKIYLCSLLSKNKLYSTRGYWIDLMEMKLFRRVEELMTRMESKINENSENLLNSIGLKLKGIFGKEEEIVKENVISLLFKKENKIKTIYERFPVNKKPLCDKIVISELYSIMKEFIPHFANFSYDISEAIDLIVEMSTKYKLRKEKISYFVTYLNSSYFTIKNTNNKKKQKKKQKKSSEILLDYVFQATTYLEDIDLLNILKVSKTIKSKLSKKIYRMLLQKDNITLQRRVEIWKSILDIVIII